MCLVGLVVLWGGKGVLIGYIYEPIRAKKQRIKAADDRLRRMGDEQFQIVRTQQKLKEWKDRSLPPKEIDAQRLYKEWLTQLAEVVGFDGLQVKADRRELKQIGRGRNKVTVYHAVQVKLEGKTTFARLNRFLYYFDRTKLMHRINDLVVTSESNEGNPLLNVKLTAEALSFAKAKDRPRLFPETELAADSSLSELKVTDAKKFPKKGTFHVRVGKDLLTVTERDGNLWKFRPGVDPRHDDPDVPNLEKAVADRHSEGDRVELIPLEPVGDKTLLTYYKHVYGPGKSPFVLPAPPPVYRPRWSGMRDQRISRSDRVRMKVEAVDLDPKKGTATYALGDTDLKDLKLDPKTGLIEWEPGKEHEAKTYSVQVLAHQGDGKQPILKDTFRITLSDPNRAPVLERLSDKSVMVGQTLKFTARASDPDEEDRRNLKFSLSDAPPGAKIDSDSGEFVWTPGEADVAGDYTITVNVSDGRSRDARRDSRRLRIRLLEDSTRFVNLIGIVTDSGEREAWLYDHSTKTKTVVKEGLPFKVAGVSGFVFVIGDEFIEFQSEGTTWRVNSGDTLAEKQMIAPPQRAVTSKAAKPKPEQVVDGADAGSREAMKPAFAKLPVDRSEPTNKLDVSDPSVVKKPQ